jgi:hypothetical protein
MEDDGLAGGGVGAEMLLDELGADLGVGVVGETAALAGGRAGEGVAEEGDGDQQQHPGGERSPRVPGARAGERLGREE